MIFATSSNNGAKREEPERKTGLVNQDTGAREGIEAQNSRHSKEMADWGWLNKGVNE